MTGENENIFEGCEDNFFQKAESDWENGDD